MASTAVIGCVFNGTNSMMTPTLSTGNYGFGGIGKVSSSIKLEGPDAKLVCDEGEIKLNDLVLLMRNLQDVLCVIRENADLNEKYPALKNLYDQFRMVEKMVKSEE